ncbi:MAG: sel1 repeat family protein [Hyphomicrobiales bacterium]|nr:sel1 repeat family protein [Rickettsiales bacterium]MCP5361406.1 sel1 repeat family protein [Hyphomicrobiales bacterium]
MRFSNKMPLQCLAFLALTLLSVTSCASSSKQDESLEQSCFKAYFPGKEGARNYTKAIEACGKLVEQENTTGYRIYGLMYLNGNGFPKDKEKAKYYYGKIYEIYYQHAKQGFPMAELAISNIYEDSRGVYPVESNPDKTLFWIERAASHKPCDKGYVKQPEAVRRALLYAAFANLRGTHNNIRQLYAVDYTKAYGYFRRLAEEFNDNRGHLYLGKLLEEGNGVKQDLVESYKHYLLGDTFKKSTSRARKRLEKQMTREQIAEAKHRAKEWKKHFKLAIEQCKTQESDQ